MFMDILALLLNLNQEWLLKNNIMWENELICSWYWLKPYYLGLSLNQNNFEKNRNVHVGYVDLLLQGFAICTF